MRRDGRNPLSRKWNSFTGFSAFDSPFVYYSLNGSLDLEGSITPHSTFISESICQLPSLSFNYYPWSREFLFLSFSQSSISIERPLPARSSDEFLPSNRQYGWSVDAVHAKIVTVGTARWWFICRVNRKTKPLDSLTAKERGRELSMQSDASGSVFETI